MAIAEMKKVMIASHRSEVGLLLEALQQEGIVQVLDAERAMISKEWPDLQVEGQRPRNIQDLVGRLEKAIDFLKVHTTVKGETSIFKPLVEVDSVSYSDIVSGTGNTNTSLFTTKQILKMIEKYLQTKLTSRKLTGLYSTRNQAVLNIGKLLFMFFDQLTNSTFHPIETYNLKIPAP